MARYRRRGRARRRLVGGGRTVAAPAAAETPAAAVPSVAVLPFHSLTGPEDEYLGLGMADALITRLGSTRTVIVRSTGAVRRYVRSDVDPLAAGRELRVDAVLDGSIQAAAGRVRATVRMLRVSDGATLWAESFDERAGDIFSLQDSISKRVSGALALRLSESQRALLTRRDTEDVEAYQLYLKGRFFWNKRTREGFQRGLALFEQAVERDPAYARAHAGVADSNIGLTFYEYERPHDAMPRAKAAALRALAIAPTLAEAHASLAHIEGNYEWDWAAAERGMAPGHLPRPGLRDRAPVVRDPLPDADRPSGRRPARGPARAGARPPLAGVQRVLRGDAPVLAPLRRGDRGVPEDDRPLSRVRRGPLVPRARLPPEGRCRGRPWPSCARPCACPAAAR